MKKFIRAVLEKLVVTPLQAEQEEIRLAIGSLESRIVRNSSLERLHDAEFRVFSQFGEDGIIQHLVSRIPIPNQIFVEFGVQDYRESNTRFLLLHDNWRGLILDGGREHIHFIEKGQMKWRYHIDAVQAFITKENINQIISGAGISGDIGLLSVDIDGNDYWVYEAINAISPRILVMEYNSVFGSKHAVNVPYRADFDRKKAHYSHLYWGASLKALCLIAQKKGYSFVGSNSAGNNAFFVRNDVLGDLKPLLPEEGYVPSRFRESRNQTGELNYIGPIGERRDEIKDLSVFDVENNRMIAIGALD